MAGLTLADKAAVWARARVDYEFFAKHFLKIRALRKRPGSDRATWGWDPFLLNSLQRTMNEAIFGQSSAGVEERVLVLKSRKDGVSTNAQGIAFWRCAFNELFEVSTIAHREESTAKISKISQGFNAQLPDPLKPMLGAKVKGSGLVWANGSSIDIQTARSDDASRSASPSMVHLSEVSFFDAQRAKTSAGDMMQATLAGMDDLPGTSIIAETTSRGPAGEFYERWLLAENPATSGWIRLFFSWKDREKYTFEITPEEAFDDLRMRRHHAAGEHEQAMQIAARLGYSVVWFRRAMEWGLTPPQVRWAQKTQNGKFKGDLNRFDREFPISWQIAFSTSGRTVLSRQILDAWRDAPVPAGMLVGGALIPGGSSFELDHTGDGWQIYALPVPGHEYAVGVDSSAGRGTEQDGERIAEGDYAAISVLDRHTGEQVAEFYSKTTEPGPLGIQALRVAVLYNRAFVVPERNNHGHLVIDRLISNGYTRIYREGNVTRSPRAGTHLVEQLGFWTDQASRTPLYDAWADAVRDGHYKPKSKRQLHEAETFVYDAWDRPDHMKGRQSDAITASALSWHGHRSLPAVRPAQPAEEPYLSELDEALKEWRRQARAPRPKRGGRHGGYMGGVT